MLCRKCVQILMTVFFLIIITTIMSGLADASTVVNPGRFIFNLKPGEMTTGAIEVTNSGEEPIEVRAVLYDWTLSDSDELVIFPGKTRDDSLNDLVKFNPRQFKLGPKEKQLVRFSIKVPETGFDSERKGIVFFEQDSPFEQDGIGAKVTTQVGTTIYVIPTTVQMVFRLAKVQVYFPPTGDPLGLVLVGNEGVAHVRYSFSYKVVGEKGKVLEEGSVSEQVLLAGFHRVVSFPLKTKLENGRYNLVTTFQFYGTDRKVTSSVPFEVTGGKQ